MLLCLNPRAAHDLAMDFPLVVSVPELKKVEDGSHLTLTASKLGMKVPL